MEILRKYIMSWRITGARYPIWAGEIVLLMLVHLALILLFVFMIHVFFMIIGRWGFDL